MKKISFNENWEYGHIGDESLKRIFLPHDAMLPEKRDEDAPAGKNTGWIVGYDYVYVKKFVAPAEWKDENITLEFEGIYKDAKVFLNGEPVGQCDYGYRGFYVSLDSALKYGEENELKVECFNADQPNSRWYSGAGIYRPVTLIRQPKKHIELDGIKIRTTDYHTPEISVTVATNAPGKVWISVFDGETVLASAGIETEGSASVFFALPGAGLWTPETPKLYTLKAVFGEDEQTETFGIRTITVNAQAGLRINGEPLILRGACIHHDNGILGAATYDYSEKRRIRILMENGYNAIRCAHNPCSKGLLKACDELGMLILDEYVDMWYIHKNKYDYALKMEQNWHDDLRAMVDKDYNHPSVIMYSTGNEVGETAQERGIQLTGDMTQYLHSLDDGRPVTCGINVFFNLLSSLGFGVYSDKKADKEAKKNEEKQNKQKEGEEKPKKKKKSVGSEFYNNLAGLFGDTMMKVGATFPGVNKKTKGAFANLDIAGYNYGIKRYKGDMKKYPDRVILGSETFCADAREFWLLAKEYPAIIGDFVWAGMDYLGEVGIGSWEHKDYAPAFDGGVGWVTAGSGRIDLNGRPLGEALYTRTSFDLDPVRMAVVRADDADGKHSPSAWKMSEAWESWSWDGCDGRETQVEVYSGADSIELKLNGNSIAKEKMPKKGRISIGVKYEPGELQAIAYDKDGNIVGSTKLASGRPETVLTVRAEEKEIGTNDLAYVRLTYTDPDGVWKPLARGDIKVAVTGGTLLGLGSACPYNEKGYLNDTTDTYFGEALAIVKPDGPGEIVLTAESPYGNGEAAVSVKA